MIRLAATLLVAAQALPPPGICAGVSSFPFRLFLLKKPRGANAQARFRFSASSGQRILLVCRLPCKGFVATAVVS